MDLTTLTSVTAFLEADIDNWKPEWDDLINWLISAVSAEMEGYCKRGFEQVERIEYHDGGGRYLYLRAFPVTEIESIKGSDDWDWEAESALSPADYALNAQAGMVLYRGGYWPYGPGAVQVIYSGGFALIPATGEIGIPVDLEGAACRQVSYAFKRRVDLGLESVSFPDGSIQKMASSQFLPEVKAVLDRYRLRRVG